MRNHKGEKNGKVWEIMREDWAEAGSKREKNS
jgi:hypothetical protein